jgi:hypothetical protein
MPLMLHFAPTRIARTIAASAFFAAALSLQVCAQSAPPSATPNQAPIEHHPPHPNTFHPNPSRPNGEHLAEWMSHHSNLTLEQQQKALAAEPGFNALPPAKQQNMRDTLTKLNAMTPAQRQHLLEKNEAIERMTPAQYAQYHAAMKQLNDLPPQQRVYVARTFRGLRELSPPQRQAVLNSERFDLLTDAQRATLNSLMQIEPLLPPPYDDGAPTHPPSQQ